MHLPKFAVPIACFISLMLFAAEARCDAKHFQASQRHFEDLASKAASLAMDMDGPGEKNACNFFTSTGMIYATRAHCMAQLSDISAHVRLPEDKAMLRLKLTETQAYTCRYVQADLKVLESLASSTHNTRIRDLGLRLINELRVFENNAISAAKE